MIELSELLKQGRHEELWQRCCGFVELRLEDFMKIQKRLLLEQMELLKKCELGHYIFNGTNPRGVEDFREQVPLTTYADYAPYLLRRRRNVLPAKPLVWLRTSRENREYPIKWIPVSGRLYDELGAVMLGILIFSSCHKKGEITLKEHDKYLCALAPLPYLSGIIGRRMDEELIFDFLPSLDEAEKMSFSERIQQGFRLALLEGLDIFAGESSVLASVGERFNQRSVRGDIKHSLSNPKALLRLARGLVKSTLAHHPLLPRDVWSLKGIVSGGTDTTVFKDKIREVWGHYPLDTYGRTEATLIATQTWDYQGMTFIPNLNFFEFIPESDSLKLREDPYYQPSTLLLDEVRAGETYELVITNLLGGALVRYRIGDMITITSRRNAELDIDIPQMVFYSSLNDLIDIDGFTRLTENTIWQAIERSGVAYQDWTVRREGKAIPKLHLYLELQENGYRQKESIALDIHQQLKEMDSGYAKLESLTGRRPLEVTLLPGNAFQDYRLMQQASGADLGHFKIPHVNPSDSMLDFMTHKSGEAALPGQREIQPTPVHS